MIGRFEETVDGEKKCKRWYYWEKLLPVGCAVPSVNNKPQRRSWARFTELQLAAAQSGLSDKIFKNRVWQQSATQHKDDNGLYTLVGLAFVKDSP